MTTTFVNHIHPVTGLHQSLFRWTPPQTPKPPAIWATKREIVANAQHTNPIVSQEDAIINDKSDREALIAELRGVTPIDMDYSDMAELADRAADMLEADAQEIARLGAVVSANHAWHLAHDDFDGYAESALAALNTASKTPTDAQQVVAPQIYKAKSINGHQHDTGRVYTGDGSFFADTASLADARLIANALNATVPPQVGRAHQPLEKEKS